jgi:DNA phosphorothioation-dependent restriction protein DptH
MITPAHARLLGGALLKLLGLPARGAVAFLRCMPPELLDQCIDCPQFEVTGYRVFAVLDATGHRRITADAAVELREEKGDAILFLIDPSRAGAGLDGIYSASREIFERALFDAACERARAELRKLRGFTKDALSYARRIGQRNVVSPWQEFDFLVALQGVNSSPGAAIAKLGLWPVDSVETPDLSTLALATGMVNRLLYDRDESRLQKLSVDALLLDDPHGTQATALERFLREASNRSPLDAIALLATTRRDLWLGPLKPQYMGDALRAIKLLPWRGNRGDALKWSGLREDSDGQLHFIIDRNAPTRVAPRLEVRWNVEPDGLRKGAVEYRVSVLSDAEEELAARTELHKEDGPQRTLFTIEDFEDLDDAARFVAVVRVSPTTSDALFFDQSEEFTLELGQAPEVVSSGSGEITQALVLGALQIGDRETLDLAARDSQAHATEDKKGFVSWRIAQVGKSVRVLRPHLLRKAEEDWGRQNGAIGRCASTARQSRCRRCSATSGDSRI